MGKTPYYYKHSIQMAGKEYVHESNRGDGYNHYSNLRVEYPNDIN